MKTHELLNTPEAGLVTQLKTMKLKELERHAQKLISNQGGDFNEVMRNVIKAIPALDPTDNDRYQAIQQRIQSHISPGTAPDLIQRITVLVTVIITRKFQKIHNTDRQLH
ncbi:hypothetical protein [Teredinibacter haidensis]|uniref:hypothetical protein n=1 Tax=Teredinibacter haidensis TaxID=2731755 RepID=UPI000948AF72|nr:hypothetical protein [Teredinibacter haidensis]